MPRSARTSRQILMASLMFSSASSFVSPWLTQPGIDGHSTTQIAVFVAIERDGEDHGIPQFAEQSFHRANCFSTSAGAVEPYDRNALTALATPRTSRSPRGRARGGPRRSRRRGGRPGAQPRCSQRPTRWPTISWRGALGDALLDQVFHQGRGVEEALVEPGGDPVGAEASRRRRRRRPGRGRRRRCRRRRTAAPCLPGGRGCRPAGAP